MSRIIALTDSETAMGFRLAGIEVVVPEDDAGVRDAVNRFFQIRESALVIVNEDYLSALPERTHRRVEESLKPLFVPVPVIRSWREGERKEEYLARMLRRVVGYQVKIRR